MSKITKHQGGNFPSFIEDFFNDRFFGKSMFDLDKRFFAADAMPSTNISETDAAFEVELSAPGFDKNDFHIEVDDHVLTVKAKKEDKKEEEDKDKKYYRREFYSSSISRAFTLPENAKADAIDARYENGILKLSIPKKQLNPPQEKKRINVS